MISSYWRRNFGGLAAGVLAFAAAVGLTGWFDHADESTDVNASQMTRSRVHADAAWRHSDFDEAVLHLSDLLAADPHNSHARFKLACCYQNQFVLLKRSQAKLPDTTASPEDTTASPEDTTASHEDTAVASEDTAVADLKRQAIDTLKRCQRSHRYRERATYKLVELHAADRDRD